jgi:hypothetical protein
LKKQKPTAAKAEPYARPLAKEIARDLITDGTGEIANRLVMEHLSGPRLAGSGWCEGAIADLVERHFRRIEENCKLVAASKAAKKPRPR